MSDDLTIPLRRGPGPAGETGPALGLAAALGGAIAAGITLVLCMALALVAWFLADAGAHGDTTDALRAGADAWLVGHGSRITLAGTPIGMVPLGLTMAIVLGAFRSGRRAGRKAGEIDEDRALGLGVVCFAGVYVVLTVIICLVASTPDAEVGLGRGILGALLVSGIAGGLGLAVGTRRFELWLDLLPGWAREIGVGAVGGALALFAAGAVLVAVSLALSFNEASNVLTSLDLSAGDAVTLLIVTVLFAPNAILLGNAYLLGPGFAFGTIAHGVTTSVSPAAPVVLGAIPAFPILAALPDQGPTPGWLISVCAVPALCAAYGVFAAGKGGAPVPLDLGALRGAGAGLVGALVVTIAIALAGGPMGVDRLAEIGAPLGDTLVFALASLVIGGAFGGLVGAWTRNRADRLAAASD